MLVGYARTSADDQDLKLQRDALAGVGCKHVLEDTALSIKAERVALADLLSTLCRGDILVIWRLDRLGRSLKEVISRAEQLNTLGVGLRSLQDNLDTSATEGCNVFHMFNILANFEHNLARERARAGLAAAQSRESKSGRKKRLDSAEQEQALTLLHEGRTVVGICRLMGVGRSTLYRYIAAAKYDDEQFI